MDKIQAIAHNCNSHFEADCARGAETSYTPQKIGLSMSGSRATVDALVEATARVLLKEGYDRASTNRIGRSGGRQYRFGLYQYFPSKEALLAAVIDRQYARDFRGDAQRGWSRQRPNRSRLPAREFVSVAIDGHRVNPKLHGVLAEQIPHCWAAAKYRGSRARGFLRWCEPISRRIAMRSMSADLDLAAFVLVTVVEALTHAAVLVARTSSATRKQKGLWMT